MKRSPQKPMLSNRFTAFTFKNHWANQFGSVMLGTVLPPSDAQETTHWALPSLQAFTSWSRWALSWCWWASSDVMEPFRSLSACWGQWVTFFFLIYISYFSTALRIFFKITGHLNEGCNHAPLPFLSVVLLLFGDPLCLWGGCSDLGLHEQGHSK